MSTADKFITGLLRIAIMVLVRRLNQLPTRIGWLSLKMSSTKLLN